MFSRCSFVHSGTRWRYGHVTVRGGTAAPAPERATAAQLAPGVQAALEDPAARERLAAAHAGALLDLRNHPVPPAGPLTDAGAELALAYAALRAGGGGGGPPAAQAVAPAADNYAVQCSYIEV